MPISAPFNLALYRRNRAYIDDYTVNGESYTLEQLLNYLSENLGGEGTVLPVYDNEAEALADGIVSGQRWKYSRNNTDGAPAGAVIEQL
jgi:hypothetical protein